MQENVNWLIAASIILLWPPSNGVQFITKNSENDLKSFVENILLRNRQSDERFPPDSSVKNSVTTDTQSSSMTTSLSQKNGIGISPDNLVSRVVELHKTGRTSQTFAPPALSEKDTLRIVSLDRYPEATIPRTLLEKDDANTNSSLRWSTETGKRSRERHIQLGRYYLRNDRKFHLDLQKEIFRNIPHSGKCHVTSDRLRLLPASSFHDRNLEQYKSKNTSSTLRIFSQRRSPNVINSSSTLRRLKRRTVQYTEHRIFKSTELPSILVKDTVEANTTHTSQDYSSTGITHPVTQKPVDHFEPWFTKSQFITATTSSLMIVTCLGVIIFYIRRRRRLRSEDPERRKLIPFRVSVGVYYNQTGPCF